MLSNLPLLSLMIWIPVLGGILTLIVGRGGRNVNACTVAVITALLTVAFSIPLYTDFDNASKTWQFVEKLSWISVYDINYYLGVDGISMPLIILSNYTTLIVILASWLMIRKQLPQYLAVFLVMQGMVNGVFVALDAMLFYLFWEAMLIPMYLAIGMWGSQARSYAAIKFFIFTFFGSALLLIALLYLGMQSGSFAIEDFYSLPLSMTIQILIFTAFFLAFAVKIPMWPVHSWLPLAHTEAPAGGSVILAALMLKIGAYGFLRFTMPIVPDASSALAWVMIVLSLIAIVYIGFIAIAQTDMKKLIAYSSIAHMGFVTLGCFMIYVIIANTGDPETAYMSMEGGVVQMISHAFGSGALFLGFGMLYEQMHTRQIKNFGGIASAMPIFTAFYLVFAMSNVALPGTSGFVGEFMVLLSAFKANIWIAIIGGLTLIIGAVYTLWMFKRVFYGPIVHDEVNNLNDIGWYPILLFSLLALGVFFLGLYPLPLLDALHSSVGNLLELSTQTKL